jgi:hypothetical protein
MHNFTLMGASGAESSNAQILEAACSYDFYHHFINAASMEDMSNSGIPSYELGSLFAFGYPNRWVLQDGDLTNVGGFTPRHQEWRDGVLSMGAYYSCESSGGNLVWTVSIVPVTNGAAPPLSNVVEITRPAPSAGVMHYIDLTDVAVCARSQINGSHVGAVVSVGRNGASADDTNSGGLYIYGIETIYRELHRVVGSK